MKIIDLLNKIANGEEVPKKIKLFGVLFEYNIEKGTYISYYDKFNLLDMNNHLLRKKSINLLNEEVKIAEEDKKIEKIDMFDYFTGYDFDNTSIDLRKHLEVNFQTLNNKINEIIDKVNKINIILSPLKIDNDKCVNIEYLNKGDK